MLQDLRAMYLQHCSETIIHHESNTEIYLFAEVNPSMHSISRRNRGLTEDKKYARRHRDSFYVKFNEQKLLTVNETFYSRNNVFQIV